MSNEQMPRPGLVTLEAHGPLRGELPEEIPWAGGRLELLLDRIVEQAPVFGEWRHATIVLHDSRPCAPGEHVPAGARIELLPPVSGG